jgi:carbon monoxide dehydrogenase subunit G
MPGCEKLEAVEENKYKGILNVKVGPVQGKFEGLVTISEVNPAVGYTIQVDGRGAAGFMKGVGQVQLEDQGANTLIHYGGDAQVGGRIASVGQRLLDTTAKSMTRQSLEGLHQQIKARTGQG